MDETYRLAVRLKKHDENAFGRLLEKYTPMVSAIVLNIGSGTLTTEDAEEIVSDVFVALWKNADRFEPEKFRGYLAAIAKTKTYDYLAGMRQIHHADIEETDVEDNFSITDISEKEELKRVLIEIIGQISEPDREILIRHYFYYQKIREIAASMRLTEENVKVRLHRTRNRLRKILTERGFAE